MPMPILTKQPMTVFLKTGRWTILSSLNRDSLHKYIGYDLVIGRSKRRTSMARQSLQPFSTNVTESSKKIREKVDHRNDPASDKNKVKLVKPKLRSVLK